MGVDRALCVLTRAGRLAGWWRKRKEKTERVARGSRELQAIELDALNPVLGCAVSE